MRSCFDFNTHAFWHCVRVHLFPSPPVPDPSPTYSCLPYFRCQSFYFMTSLVIVSDRSFHELIELRFLVARIRVHIRTTRSLFRSWWMLSTCSIFITYLIVTREHHFPLRLWTRFAQTACSAHGCYVSYGSRESRLKWTLNRLQRAQWRNDKNVDRQDSVPERNFTAYREAI